MPKVFYVDPPTPEQIAAFEEAYGRIAVSASANARPTAEGQKELPEWTVVLRRPKRGEYKMFRAQSKQDKADAQEALVRSIMVYPATDQIDPLFEEYPALAEGVSRALSSLVGMAVRDDGK